MTRTISSGLQTALEASSVELYFAVELLFDSGALRMWTGIGNKSIDGNTYFGTGSLLSIGGLGESLDMTANNATITLAGVDTNLISLALQEPYQNRNCKIYMGSLATTDVATIFSGTMDTMTINDDGETSTVSINVESRIARLDRPKPFRYTSAQQRNRYTGDTFFDWVAKLADKQVYWGKDSA